ncbi:MAG TPA: large conductance mechanosensitive channel protein MscL [Candidatus Saccharimonadales bacterium]|nr:large conductance mechanosensitive channel protein MscL [Candidatus Saccharimonadales bacterium]
MKEFRQFLLRGNVVDLAVGVVVGAAFGVLVSSFVSEVLTPLIGAIGSGPNFQNLALTIHKSSIHYGIFLNSLISFLIVASVVFFFVVKPVNHLTQKFSKGGEVAKKCPECLSEIPAMATRCAFCTTKFD